MYSRIVLPFLPQTWCLPLVVVRTQYGPGVCSADITPSPWRGQRGCDNPQPQREVEGGSSPSGGQLSSGHHRLPPYPHSRTASFESRRYTRPHCSDNNQRTICLNQAPHLRPHPIGERWRNIDTSMPAGADTNRQPSHPPRKERIRQTVITIGIEGVGGLGIDYRRACSRNPASQKCAAHQINRNIHLDAIKVSAGCKLDVISQISVLDFIPKAIGIGAASYTFCLRPVDVQDAHFPPHFSA